MKTKSILSSVFCCLLVLSFVGTCSAMEITSDELNRLDQNLTQLANINNQLTNDLMLSKKDLILVRTDLVECQKELLTTQKELLQLSVESKTAKQESTKAIESLAKANQLLTTYEKETNSEIRKLKLQRDLVIVGVVALLFKK